MKSKMGPEDSSLAVFERQYVRPNPGRTLIVGSRVYGDKPDRRSLYANAVGVDMQEGEGVDVVMDLEGPLDVGLGQFDHVECMSVLEHCRKPWKVAEALEFYMASGASIFVSVPFAHRFHGYPDDYYRMTPEAFKVLFPQVEWQTLKFASTKLFDGPKIPVIKHGDHPYISRTNSVGFGYRK